MQRIENYSADTTLFAVHRRFIDATIAANVAAGATVAPSYVNGPAHGVNYGAGGAFYGGCLMRNGKALLSPSSNDNIFIFDHLTNTLTMGPAHQMTKPAFLGAISVSDTLVVLPPDASDYIGLYNPVTNAFTRGPAKPQIGLRYAGGCVLPNGKVFLAPQTATAVAIYDPVTNTVTTGAEMTGRGGAQLMPNGMVFCPPSADTGGFMLLYDPATDSVIPVNISYPETRDAVPIADGRLACVPTDMARVFLFDFRNRNDLANPIVTGTASWPNNVTNKFWGGALAANGDVVFAPYGRPKVGYYRPPSLGQPLGQVFDGPDMPVDGIVERFTGCIPLLDGRFLMVPRKFAYVGLYTHLTGAQPLPPSVLMSPFYSNSF